MNVSVKRSLVDDIIWRMSVRRIRRWNRQWQAWADQAEARS